MGFYRVSLLVLALCLATALPDESSAQIKLKSVYDCAMISGNGAGAFRTGDATNCRYFALKERTFVWSGEGATGLTYTGSRAMSQRERSIPDYWIKNFDKLDASRVDGSFDLRSFLSRAANAANTYVLTSNVRGNDRIDLVYVESDGTHLAMHVPSDMPEHPPYGLWISK